MGPLKDRCDGLQAAEARYESDVGSSSLAVQIMTLQQQIQSDKLESLEASKYPDGDYSVSISQSIITAEQVRTDLDSGFGSVSALIDALPSQIQNLRQLRDKMRSDIYDAEAQVGGTLKPTAEDNTTRLAQVEIAVAKLAVQEIPVLVLGDRTLSTMRSLKEEDQKLLSRCTTAFWLFALVNFGLAIYGAAVGVELNG